MVCRTSSLPNSHRLQFYYTNSHMNYTRKKNYKLHLIPLQFRPSILLSFLKSGTIPMIHFLNLCSTHNWSGILCSLGYSIIIYSVNFTCIAQSFKRFFEHVRVSLPINFRYITVIYYLALKISE